MQAPGAWLAGEGELFLRNMGIAEGFTVLDFGCGNGAYTIPAAVVVGKEGKVYAVDRDKSALGKLTKTAASKELGNIVPLNVPEELELNLEDKSVDAALLYDVLHYMDEGQRKKVYGEIYRVLKIGGILSVYPKHNRSDWPLWNLSDMDVEDIVEEIKSVNFHFDGKYLKTLVHDGNYEEGVVLMFRKGVLIAFGTDDGEKLNDSHFGSAEFFHIYRFYDGKAELVEKRKNIKIEEEEIKGGDPKKAGATARALDGIDVLVGRRFGPNITRMLNRFGCVVVRTDSIKNAVDIVQNNMDKIIEEANKGKDRKHIVLR
ncbi:MAG: methyltransferase domain-containing protein [Nitrospiraceae bacterium]|nr:methyltransferase domain-containing protein [Nitrospiraceae bacterium]